MTEQPQELRVGYHRDLDAITSKVVRLFALVSEAVAAANEAFLGDDQDALASVRAGEKTIDELMVELEGDIERLLLLQAPVAGELRYALAIIRIVPELERSGDLAEHIAKRAGLGPGGPAHPHRPRACSSAWAPSPPSCGAPPPTPSSTATPTAGEALEQADDEIDDLHTALTSELLSSGLPASVAADATLVARFYERLGDHAVHIAGRVAQRRRVAARTTSGRRSGRLSPWHDAFHNSNPALSDAAFERIAASEAGWAAGTEQQVQDDLGIPTDHPHRHHDRERHGLGHRRPARAGRGRRASTAGTRSTSPPRRSPGPAGSSRSCSWPSAWPWSPCFKPNLARFTAPIYALLEGAVPRRHLRPLQRGVERHRHPGGDASPSACSP